MAVFWGEGNVVGVLALHLCVSAALWAGGTLSARARLTLARPVCLWSLCHMHLCALPRQVNASQTIYKNYQKLTLQESPGSVPAGRLPRHKEVSMLCVLGTGSKVLQWECFGGRGTQMC